VRLADALYHSGAVSDAVNQWQVIGRLNQSRSGQFLQDAGAASRGGHSGEASRLLARAFELDSANSDLALLLAHEKQAGGDVAGAIELLRSHLQWHPDRPAVVGYLSQLLSSQKKETESALLANRYRALTGHAWENLP